MRGMSALEVGFPRSRFNKAPVRNAKHVRAKVLPTENARNDVPRREERGGGRMDERTGGRKLGGRLRAASRRAELGLDVPLPFSSSPSPLVLEGSR